MSTLILIAAALSTLVLTIVLSGILILSIRDLIPAFSDNTNLPSADVSSGAKSSAGEVLRFKAEGLVPLKSASNPGSMVPTT